MKKILTLAVFTLGFTGTALAHGDYDANGPTRAKVKAYNMTCSEVQSAIHSSGAAIVYESAHIYDRYVSSGYYCPAGTYERPTWIRTSDTAHCPVSKCQEYDIGG